MSVSRYQSLVKDQASPGSEQPTEYADGSIDNSEQHLPGFQQAHRVQ